MIKLSDNTAKNATCCTTSMLQGQITPNANMLTFVYQTGILTQLEFTCYWANITKTMTENSTIIKA